ncbi:MAG: HAMP domain-containing protein, partial [Desulfobacterales bacterium]|nr:HAMP domain-containing protein [Desulfobacterales bacterium]
MATVLPCQDRIREMVSVFFLIPSVLAVMVKRTPNFFINPLPRSRVTVESRSIQPSLAGLYWRNYIANLGGNLIIVLLNLFTPIEFFKDWQAFLLQGDGWVMLVFIMPMVFVMAGVLQYLIQRPISRSLKQLRFEEKMDTDRLQQARRRLLNLPIDLGLLNLIMWTALTVLFIFILYLITQIALITCLYIFFRGMIIGLMASFISFFLVDDYCRNKLMPLFFPEGRLSVVPGTIKISILRRIRVLYAAGTSAPMIILVGTLALLLWQMQDALVSALDFGKDLFGFIIVLYVIFVAVALGLNVLVAKSIVTPIKDMMAIVKKVRHGDLGHRVRVVSNDELGVLGDGMNEMTAGLIERDRMRRSLHLAREVQQILLPRENPEIEGLDIAATIVYCDETGGDYYDFLDTGET